MVAQMLLQCPSDRVFLRRARRRLGHLFPYLPSQSRYNERCRALDAEARSALEGTRRRNVWCRRRPAAARHDSASLRPVGPDDADEPAGPLGRASATARPTRGATGASSSSCSAQPTARSCDFDLVAANTGEREAALALLEANPIEGATIICDKGFAGADFEAAVRELRALLLRPSSADEPDRPNPPIGWIRQTDRIDRQHTQRPAPARTSRRPHPRRAARPRHRAHPRPLRLHQPQPTTRTQQPRTHRLHRLTDQPSRVRKPTLRRTPSDGLRSRRSLRRDSGRRRCPSRRAQDPDGGAENPQRERH